MSVAIAQRIAASLDGASRSEARRVELVALLSEEHPLCRELGLSEITNVRGFVLAAFERLGLPEAALPFVLEELQTGHAPYSVAAAAKAVRGLGAPSPELEPFLLRALDNLAGRDEIVSFGAFDEYTAPRGDVTALAEVRISLAWLRQACISGACCALPELAWGRSWFGANERQAARRVMSARFEDHDERTVSFAELFVGKPALVAFFYTRCENPRKCSLTLSKLGRVQARLHERGLAAKLQLAAITYDPLYDLPARLRAYAEARGLSLGAGARVLRAPDDFGALRAHFRLGVGFLRSVVSRHRIELYLLDESANVAGSFTRLEWSEDEVVSRLAQLVEAANASAPRPAARRRVSRALLSLLPPVLLALVPKCPLCWAAYLSVLGIAGLERLPYPAFAAPFLLSLVAVNVLAAFWRARAQRCYWPFLACLSGALLLAPLAFGQRWLGLAPAGVALSLLGVLGGAGRARALPLAQLR
jgi:protein SCO1